MFKKLLVASAILAASSSIALANGAPYLGGSIGVQANTSNNSNAAYQGGSNARVVPVTLSAGYGAVIAQNFYLAGEIFGTPGSFNINDNGLKSTYGYGISFIPGLMLSEHTMAYARAGLVRTRFSHLDNKTGAQLGLGMQTSVTQNWDLRTEYVFSAYRKIHNVSTLRSDAFNIGAVYKFD